MFSRTTIIKTIECLNFQTHAVLERFLLQFGLESIIPESASSIAAKENAIINHLIRNPGLHGPLGSDIVFEIIEECIRHPYYPIEGFPPDLLNSLRRDGFTIEDNRLRRIMPETVDLSQHENEISLLLDRYRFTTAKGHLAQAINAHTRGEWAAANGQLRPFIENLFYSIAKNLGYANSSDFYAIGRFLSSINPPFILISLNEWREGNDKGFLQGLWKRLHPHGPHPGLSDEEDCTFRVQTVILTASHYLRRLNTRLS